MGDHTEAEIPNSWAFARDFAFDDHMFEPVRSWSLPIFASRRKRMPG